MSVEEIPNSEVVIPFSAGDVADILRERGWTSSEISAEQSAWCARAAFLLGPQAANRDALASLLRLVFEYDAARAMANVEAHAVMSRYAARDVIRLLAHRSGEDACARGQTFNVVDGPGERIWTYLSHYMRGSGQPGWRMPVPYWFGIMMVRLAFATLFRTATKVPSILIPRRFESRTQAAALREPQAPGNAGMDPANELPAVLGADLRSGGARRSSAPSTEPNCSEAVGQIAQAAGHDRPELRDGCRAAWLTLNTAMRIASHDNSMRDRTCVSF